MARFFFYQKLTFWILSRVENFKGVICRCGHRLRIRRTYEYPMNIMPHKCPKVHTEWSWRCLDSPPYSISCSLQSTGSKLNILFYSVKEPINSPLLWPNCFFWKNWKLTFSIFLRADNFVGVVWNGSLVAYLKSP